MIAYLGIGGNEEGSLSAIENVLVCLKLEPSIHLKRISSLYKNKAWGNEDQADFLNMVIEIDTHTTPSGLLDFCLALELKIGRQRSSSVKWGPRLIDIDILSYGDVVCSKNHLILPHPFLLEREFFYIPLLEINQDVEIPEIGLLKKRVKLSHSMYKIKHDFEV